MKHWTFGRKLAGGFALCAAITLAGGVTALLTLRAVVAEKDHVIQVDARMLVDVEEMHRAVESVSTASRGYLLTREERFLLSLQQGRNDQAAAAGRVRSVLVSDEGKRLLEAATRAEADWRAAMDRSIALRRAAAVVSNPVTRQFEDEVMPRREVVKQAYKDLSAWGEREVEAGRSRASARASSASSALAALLLVSVAAAAGIAFGLSRSLGRQIGTAVGQVQSSAAELQAAANQQATGSREQATSMTEITTTINELLATSRQIAESAQRVAQIAADTARAAKSGTGTVQQAQESMAAIRRQTDLIVTHMLELGRKSQQIGAVLDIVTELAEQTNILAINATIEAAGAGEGGRRFSVVADEIRKLADRVADSTKEIRSLIEDVRSAVNTTVMATEGGSKAVDAGARQSSEVASSFERIGGLVTTSTEAAREIELSTKQQASAVEQVNLAVTNTAQATRENEASATQTLATASQLAGLSRELLKLVTPARNGTPG